jgi:streptomycin 6-kinase
MYKYLIERCHAQGRSDIRFLLANWQVLPYTDLHHLDVMAGTCEPWLVIDPKPCTGDPAYDRLQHMLNFPAPGQ